MKQILAVCGILIFSGLWAGAQAQSNTTPAPIPVQILTGRRAFISNAASSSPMGVPGLIYDDFYADVSKWGKFTLVNNPSDADLIFEIRFGMSLEDTFRPSTGPRLPAVRLAILDPKTHVTLWVFREFVKTANRDSTARHNLDTAILLLLDDVKKLSQTPVSGEGNAPGNQ
jgi:hypothetical protein